MCVVRFDLTVYIQIIIQKDSHCFVNVSIYVLVGLQLLNINCKFPIANVQMVVQMGEDLQLKSIYL